MEQTGFFLSLYFSSLSLSAGSSSLCFASQMTQYVQTFTIYLLPNVEAVLKRVLTFLVGGIVRAQVWRATKDSPASRMADTIILNPERVETVIAVGSGLLWSGG